MYFTALHLFPYIDPLELADMRVAYRREAIKHRPQRKVLFESITDALAPLARTKHVIDWF